MRDLCLDERDFQVKRQKRWCEQVRNQVADHVEKGLSDLEQYKKKAEFISKISSEY